MFCGEPSSNLRLSAVISTFWSEPGRVKGPEMVATSRSRLKASRSWIRLSVCLGLGGSSRKATEVSEWAVCQLKVKVAR